MIIYVIVCDYLFDFNYKMPLSINGIFLRNVFMCDNNNEFEPPINTVADILIDDFDKSGAKNYRECIFEYKDGREFVLNVSLKNGLTQAEIISKLTEQLSCADKALDKILASGELSLEMENVAYAGLGHNEPNK